MKFKKIRQILFVTITVINMLCIVVFGLGAIAVLYANYSSSSEGTIRFLDYSIYVTESQAEGSTFSSNTAVIVQNIDPSELTNGDLIICRELGNNGFFYPVSRIFVRATEEKPLTATVRIPEETDTLDINRDDILGKQIASSNLLGSFINHLKDPQQQRQLLLFFAGGGVILCVLLGFLYWISKWHERKIEYPKAMEKPSIDLFGMIEEQENVEFSDLPSNEIIEEKESGIEVPLSGFVKHSESQETKEEVSMK